MRHIRLFIRQLKKKHGRFIPHWVFSVYHFTLAVIALCVWRHPSRHLTVIGVTGTKGKTSTCIFLHTLLSAAGGKVGMLSTVETRIGDRVYPNTRHMTMPGRGFVQRTLRSMVRAGCGYAVIEVPSEGIRQFRDFGVRYDSVVFTNLSPEHLVTHRTFENYRDTKMNLFRRHARQQQKTLRGALVERFVLLNADDTHVRHFIDCSDSVKSKQVLFGLSEQADGEGRARMEGDSSFTLNGETYTVPLPGSITVRNVLPAILLAKHYRAAGTEVLQSALSSVTLPGRLERIDEGQRFAVFCDYAHEPLSMFSVYDALKGYAAEGGRVIMVVGAVGASRWRYNAEEIGEIAGRHADITVVTDVDPFFDNPNEIIDAVIRGAERNKDAVVHREADRRKAIHHALSIAEDTDVVIVTGKGAELTMEVKGASLPWDERGVIREELRKVLRT